MTDSYQGEDQRVREMGDNTCRAVLAELWTPGNRISPDGPSREMLTRCMLEAGHRDRHAWGVPEEVRR
jgi:hypothetical protein